jgi:hypothetical protein
MRDLYLFERCEFVTDGEQTINCAIEKISSEIKMIKQNSNLKKTVIYIKPIEMMLLDL